VVDDDATTSNCESQINRQVTPSITQISKMQISPYRVKRGQRSKVIQLFNAIHVARVYDKVNVPKDVKELIWETLQTIGQMRIGEHTDDSSVPLLAAIRHQLTPLAPNQAPDPPTGYGFVE